MSDEDKIVIPVDIDDSEARRKIEGLSDTMQRAIKSQSSRAGISEEEFYRRGEKIKQGIRDEQAAGGGEDKGAKTPPNLEQKAFGESNAEIGATAEAVRLFREALHALHPAFADAGIGLGEMQALIRASTGGVIALAAAVGGLLVVALQKASDAANDAASRIGTFAEGGNDAKSGREKFSQLKDTGRELNEFPTELAKPYEQLLRINQNQPPGEQQTDKGLQEILANLTKGLQAERVDPEKGLGAVTELLKSVREKGFVTGDSLKALEDIAPRLSATLLQELNKLKPGAASFSDQQFLTASRAAGPKINTDFAKSQEEFADSISEAWHKVKVAADRIGEASSNGNAVSKTLNAFADFLDLLASGAAKFNKFSQSILPVIGPNAKISPLDGSPSNEVDVSRGPFDKFQAPDQSKLAESGNAAADALSKVAESGEGTQKTLEEFKRRQEELGDVAKDAALKRAEIEKKFEPAETSLKLQKDEIRVGSADIHLEQAKISGLEAQRAKEESKLAPEEARERTADAQSNYDKALANFLRNRGVNTSALDAVNKRDEDTRALDSASTALKRAKIQEKYSYLEEPKADLAAEQAQTAIRSAEIEKRDANLTLAKDKSGAPITHELAQLNYAQAALDFDKVKIELLQKILDKLGLPKEDKKKDEEQKTDAEKKTAADDNQKRLDQQRLLDQQADARDYSQKADRTGVRTVEGERAAREALQPVNQPEPVSKPATREQGEPPLYRPNGPDPDNLVPRATTNRQEGTRLNPLDSEQGLSGRERPERFVGPNEQGLSGRAPREHFVGPNEQGLDGRQQGYSYTQQPPPQPVPLPQPRPPEAPQQPQSALPDPQQVASLGTAFQDLISNIAASVNGVKSRSQEPEPNGGGIRGEGTGGGSDSGSAESDVGAAASNATNQLAGLVDVLNELAGAASGDGGTVHAAGGGYIRGPGSTTSDSINARLSDEEYVHPAAATRHYGVAFMDSIRTMSLPKFAVGGMFGAMSRGMAASAPSLGRAGAVASAAPASGKSEMEHWGTIDMRTNHGDIKVATERDTMRHLGSAAQKAKRYSTGPKPGWFGGGQ